jgi:pimeloyl-ACP methyl ester carboxylesterase
VTDTPYFREAGAGTGVVCVHCNASSSAQWRSLMDRLAPRFHVLAGDSHGAGRGPAWPVDRTLRLQDEVALLQPLMARAGEPLSLVGHSYGGAVALLAALQHRSRALVLYEPTLFALLDEAAPPPNEAEGIRLTVADAAAHLARGDRGAAAECFIDFWMGEGSWQRTPEARRAPIEEAIVHVQGWGTALFTQPTPLSDFGALDVPVLLMTGSESPASSRGVARLLAGVLPRLQLMELEGLGHMGPITHPEVVNAAIEDFLMRELRA